jgi:tripartite-type tricarboxylate transporter receptor subunit TctC
MHRSFRVAAATVAVAGAALVAQPVAADPVADFYKGRQVMLVVAYPSGGMYGIASQLISRHLGKHMPGNPTIVPQYMPGAGGTKGANYLYNAAPKDGSFLGVLSKDVAVAQKLRPKAIKYNADEFAYLGRILPYTAVLMLWKSAGVTNWEQLKTKEVIIGSSGKSAHEYMEAMLLNHVAGMKIRVVHGYRGAGPMYKAMETGEIHGRIGAWGSLKTLKKHWLDKGDVFTVMQTGLSRSKDLKDLPAIIEMARNDEERRMFEVMEAGGPVGWGLQGPPKLPAAFTPALRKAFNAMVKDPEFIADINRRKVDLDPATGEEVEAVVKRTLAIPSSVVDKMRKIAGL